MTSSNIKIAVILPSRGLIFSETADELLQNLEGYEYDIFFAHGLPIPECFTEPLTEALKGDYSHIWIVEDDMILDSDILDSMLIMDDPVVTMDYPVDTKGQGVVFSDKAKRIIFTGTGCLLIKRAVFDKLEKPYFRTDIKWGVVNYGKFIRLTANSMPNLEGYGLHDVNFGIKLWQAGIPISLAGNVGQRKLLKLGKVGSNDGAHEIEEWTVVKPDVLYKRFKSYPKQPLGKLVSVLTRDGEMNVHPDHAKKLIKSGVATKPPQESVSIDLNGVEL